MKVTLDDIPVAVWEDTPEAVEEAHMLFQTGALTREEANRFAAACVLSGAVSLVAFDERAGR